MPDAAAQSEMAAVSTYVTEVAVDVATTAFRYAGGSAIHRSNILQRCLRNINAAAQHFMVSDTALENYGASLLEVPYVKRWRSSGAGRSEGGIRESVYALLYIVQVAFQVSFQVDQEADHLESDLESPGVSYGLRIFQSAKSLLITSCLCLLARMGLAAGS